MTVINACIQGRAAYLITDMAWTDQDTGIVEHITSKFIVGHDFHWGLAATGNASYAAILYQISVHEPRNAAQMLECLPKVIATLAEEAKRIGFTTFKCALTVAMWSKKDRQPVIAVIDADGSVFDMIEPMTVACVGSYIAGGGMEGFGPEDVKRRWPDIKDAALFDVERDGVALVAEQRSTFKWAHVDGAAAAHRAGGGVQLMRVGKRGVTIKTLHTWPEDRVGHLICPSTCPPRGRLDSLEALEGKPLW
jgi:hypothetical protein